MKKLIYFITNPFKTAQISVVDLIRFTTDLLERFKTQNVESRLDARIAATETALEDLTTAYTTDVESLGSRKARKIAKNRFRSDLLLAIEKINADLISVFGPQSEILREFFPSGRKIFSSCADDTLESHLSAVVNKAMLYEAEVGADLLAEVAQIRDEWDSLHDASEESTGQKADAEAKRRDARSNLENELFLNVLEIAKIHPDDPGKLGLYMQQYLIGGPASGPVTGDGGGVTPPVGGGGGSNSGSTSTSTSTSVSSSSVGSSSMGSSSSMTSSSVGSSSMGSSNAGSSGSGSGSA